VHEIGSWLPVSEHDTRHRVHLLIIRHHYSLLRAALSRRLCRHSAFLAPCSFMVSGNSARFAPVSATGAADSVPDDGDADETLTVLLTRVAAH